MNVNRTLPVQNGDVLTSFRNFLIAWWDSYGIDAMLAPVELPDGGSKSSGVNNGGEVRTQVIEDPADLNRVNPFAPLMLGNSAALTDRFIEDHPLGRLAAVMRPCEVRAYVEIQKLRRNSLGKGIHNQDYCATHSDQSSNNLVLLGVDCLGTYTQEEYFRRTQQRGCVPVQNEVIKSASQGGLKALKFRTACQICDWPAPWQADIVIGLIGVDTDRCLLLISRDEITDSRLKIHKLAGGPASEYQVSWRETVVGALADARAGMRKKMQEEMTDSCHFNELGCLLAWLANCSMCGHCLDSCPLHLINTNTSSFPSNNRRLHPERSALGDLLQFSRLLASCSGCGMCEASCERNIPITLLISALSHHIREELHYQAGDPRRNLPWS